MQLEKHSSICHWLAALGITGESHIVLYVFKKLFLFLLKMIKEKKEKTEKNYKKKHKLQLNV